MEKNRIKRIAILAVLLVLAIGFLIYWIILGQKHREREAAMREVAQNATLNAQEDTPQSVWDKALENASKARGTGSPDEGSGEKTEESEADLDTSEETESLEESAEETEQTEESEQEATDLTEEVSSEAVEKEEGESLPAAAASPDDRVIDFATLQSKKNAHIYAWISVPGTNIDYPVLRHPTDDGYYLYHNLNGSSGYPGCIYTENWNSKDWTDPVTVLYGHDMRSTGTMFHQLHKFETQSFFDKNQYIYIYTPEKTLKYRIFATYVHSNEHLLYNHDFSDKGQFTSFFDTVMSSAGGVNHVRDDVTVTTDSKVITLSTCIKNKPSNRYLVFGVLE